MNIYFLKPDIATENMPSQKEINHQILRLCGSWTIASWTHPSMHTNPWKTMEHDCNLKELDTGNWLSLKHIYFLCECLRCMELCEWNQLSILKSLGILVFWKPSE